MTTELDAMVDRARRHPGFTGKSVLALVADVLGSSDGHRGPGDDGAVVDLGQATAVVGGEALFPPFVQADPFGAGVAAVVTNVNDLAAMGARPLGIVDTVTATECDARQFLAGLQYAGSLYGVAIVGGHLTVRDGPPSASAFGIGEARRTLSSCRVAPGQVLLVATCVEGVLRADFPYFSSLQIRGQEVAGDVAVLPYLAERGACVAAKDVSMAGLLGSLAMLLEPTRSGATVDLARIARPAGVEIADWLLTFPSYSFCLCAPEDRADECRGAFSRRGLSCEVAGVLDGSGKLRARLDGEEALFCDLRHEAITGLRWERGGPATRSAQGGGG
ncbi:MAG: AIR synthase related protein [Acidimicrobiales bacterium]